MHLYILSPFWHIVSSFYLVIISLLFLFLLNAAVVVCSVWRKAVSSSCRRFIAKLVCDCSESETAVANSNPWLATEGSAWWPTPANCYDWRHNEIVRVPTRWNACGGGGAAAPGSWGRSARRRARVTAAGESAATFTHPTSQAYQALYFTHGDTKYPRVGVNLNFFEFFLPFYLRP